MHFLISIITYLLPLFYSTTYTTSEEAPTYIHQKFKKHSANELYDLHIEYPYFLIDNENKSHKLNLSIQSIMTSALKDFQHQHKKRSKKVNQNGFSYFNLSYEVVYLSESILSLKFINTLFYHGEASEKEKVSTLNFDLKNNKILKIKSIFDIETDNLRSSILSLIMEKSSCYCNRYSVYKQFCIAKEGIYFYGDDYSCPENCSTVTTFLSWSDLEDFSLNPLFAQHLL
ncbi:PdaC/SigV domain-containing protein [Sediminitomix flava]|uniref:Uncharacterized protein DUF4163 n=1 Tax=Sediminitomix flava TaxID=379075 RepID=A0A315ZB30_SEDFL|nr:DUF4163 domain-containing protein [Sediminitomix flava]PWJ42785.1 uncharacterized protein DUF4163 [Sediminitomix flava]